LFFSSADFLGLSQRFRWPLGGYRRDGLSHASAPRRDPPPPNHQIATTQYIKGTHQNATLATLRAVDGAAQLAVAHCPEERTLAPPGPLYISWTDPPVLQPAALWPSPRSVLRHESLF